jgi:hypothetical protein
MKNIIPLFLSVFFMTSSAYSQSNKIGWFITPEVGGMILENEVGKTVGASLGIKVWKNRLKLGIYTYGRPGPINSQTYTVRADQLSFGLLIAPTFKLENWSFDIPLNIGTMGAGFYFAGDDRITPDGDRVSVWENKLMDEKDAGFGTYLEAGVRAFIPSKNENIQYGVGLHFTTVQGWSTYYDPSGDFYNNKLRFSLFVNFGSGNDG